MLLALDTSTTAVTVALWDPGAGEPIERTVLGERRHGALLAPLVREVLDEAGAAPDDLAAVVAGVGPGPYTSLRVGVMTATAFALAAGVPVHGVCSHDAIAAEAAAGLTDPDATAALAVATDAKRREVFASTYRLGGPGRAGGAAFPVRTGGPVTAAAADLPAAQAVLPTAGRGPVLYPEAFAAPLPVLDVSAAWLARVAAAALDAGPAAESGVLLPPTPLYLRRPDAVEPPPRVPVGPT